MNFESCDVLLYPIKRQLIRLGRPHVISRESRSGNLWLMRDVRSTRFHVVRRHIEVGNNGVSSRRNKSKSSV